MKKGKKKLVYVSMGIVLWCYVLGILMEVHTIQAVYEMEEEIEGEELVETTKTTTVAITHAHSGSSSSGGGCYGNLHSSTYDVRCYKPVTKIAWDTCVCSDGHTMTNTVAGGYDTWPIPSGCEQTLYTTTEYYYSVNCGMTGMVLGSLTITQSPIDWTNQVVLEATYEGSAGLVLEDNPVLFTGNGVREESQQITVSQNGIYVCQLQTSSEMTSVLTSVVTSDVRNLDYTSPTIEAFLYDTTRYLQEVYVEVVAEDLQEDGSVGVGLAQAPYSYDLGKTWVEDTGFFVTENGEYEVLVKDQFQQITNGILWMNSLDTMGPTILELIQEERDTTTNTVKVTVVIDDLQEDGTQGVGIPIDAYSFDGGTTWQAEDFIEYSRNGSHTIWVRDSLDNRTKTNVLVSQFPSPLPQGNGNTTQNSYLEEGDVLEEEKFPLIRETESLFPSPIQESQLVEATSKAVLEIPYKELPPFVETESNMEVEREEREGGKGGASTLQIVLKVLLLSTASVMGVSGVAGILYYIFFGVFVVSGRCEGRKCLLGITRLKSRERLEIFVGKRIREKNITTNYILYVNPFVAKHHALEPVLIRMGEEELLKSMERCIEIEME
ncbi:MAG: hypothetical protein R3Y54_06595 [Eubacteriales bacterium]